MYTDHAQYRELVFSLLEELLAYLPVAQETKLDILYLSGQVCPKGWDPKTHFLCYFTFFLIMGCIQNEIASFNVGDDLSVETSLF